MFKKLVVLEKEDVVFFSINRPTALNAIDFEVMDELENFITQIEAHPPKILVFTAGKDGYIASGGDLKKFSTLLSYDDGKNMAEKMAAILNRIESLPCISIAFLNGLAFGGGTEMSFAFDMIWAHPQTKMGFTQLKFGLSPGWNGGTRMIERIGYQQTMNLLLSRKIITGKEALALGIAQDFFESDDAFNQRLNEISVLSKNELFGLKKVLKIASLQTDRKQKMQDEIAHFANLWAAKEHHEKVRAFLDGKR